jgi:SAM-dependent methyltransferase
MKGKIINKKTYTYTGDREDKAHQICAVLNNYYNDVLINKKILDLGCGDGEIGRYFSQWNNVVLADIEDQRIVQTTKFVELDEDGDLPFKDKSFDIVLSNHVIEHLGHENLNSHQKHLEEIKRVLKIGGICYFATPNKNYPIEPHHKLPLMHYFYDFGDIQLLSQGDMRKLFHKVEFGYKEYTMWIVRKLKGYDAPEWLSFIMPTNVFILIKGDNSGFICAWCGVQTKHPQGSMKFPVCKRCYKERYLNDNEYHKDYNKLVGY